MDSSFNNETDLSLSHPSDDDIDNEDGTLDSNCDSQDHGDGSDQYEDTDSEDADDKDKMERLYDYFRNTVYDLPSKSHMTFNVTNIMWKRNDYLLPEEVDTVVDNTEKKFNESKCGNFVVSNLGKIVHLIMDDLLKKPCITSPICMYEDFWHYIFGIAQLYYGFNERISTSYICTLFRVFCTHPNAKFNYRMKCGNKSLPWDGYMIFSKLIYHDREKLIKRIELWNLWDEIDPAIHKDGIGNYLAWLPREKIDDIIEFDKLLVEDKMEKQILAGTVYKSIDVFIKHYGKVIPWLHGESDCEEDSEPENESDLDVDEPLDC